MEKQIDELDNKIDEVHKILSDTSVQLASLFWDIPREEQLVKPNPNEWSALEILIHLRQVSDVYAQRVKRVMTRETEDLVNFKDYDENKLFSNIKLDDETAKANISEFMQSRSELLNRISLIEKSEWKKEVCNHEAEGTLTLLDLLIPLADREKNNLSKLSELLEHVESEEPELSIDTVHATLSNTSIEFSQLFWGVPREVQTHRHSENDWSPLEILVHLRIVSEVYAGRIKRAMHPDTSELIELHDFDEMKQMEKINLEDEAVRGNITAFMNSRSDLLNEISLLDAEVWDKKIAKDMKGKELTLLQLLIPLAQRETMYIAKLKEYLKDYY
ncbi:MAG: hypothetical protein GPJ54_05260 [Candidatus Heimdallarchaeota archaeon]|nr:hypothetical protein [Candidatus Heimdallarchaeota archaeon]